MKSNLMLKKNLIIVEFYFISLNLMMAFPVIVLHAVLIYLPIHLFTSCNLASNATPSTYLSPT